MRPRPGTPSNVGRSTPPRTSVSSTLAAPRRAFQERIDSSIGQLRKHFPVVVLGLIASIGVAGAGLSLYRALAAMKVQATIETNGTAVISDIQHEAQRSQAALTQVLLAKDVGQRSTAKVEARRAGSWIVSKTEELRRIDASESTTANIRLLLANWNSYVDARDRVIFLADEGRLRDASAQEAGALNVAFDRFITSLRSVQQDFTTSSALQQSAVRTGLRNALTELGALVITTVLFVATLLWSRAKQQKLLVLHKQSEQLERDRALILDMAARNEPLLAILKILATVTEKQIPGSVACFAVIERGRLCDVVAPGLPEEFLESRYVRGEPAPSTELTDNRERTFPPGLINCWSQEVLSNQGEQIGRVDIYLDESTPLDESRTGLLEGVAKLAGVVIQHREMYEQLAYQAMRDPLTGLPNRRLFQDRLEQAIHRANRNKEKVAVL